jgi:hypothetical protein
MTPTDTLSPDQAFDILSNRRRRYALHYLSSNPGGETLQELARQLAAWENAIDPDEVSKKQQKRVYVSLYQTHIPKLEAEGVVDHDDESGLITLTGRATDVTTYLQEDEDGDDGWYRYYIGLVGITAALSVATLVGISVFGDLSSALLGAVVVLAFVVLTAAYVLARQRTSEEIDRNSI